MIWLEDEMNMDMRDLSTEKLIDLKNQIKVILQERWESNRTKAIEDFCEAFNRIKKEFPELQLNMERECEDCGIFDYVDLFYYFDTLNPSDFFVDDILVREW